MKFSRLIEIAALSTLFAVGFHYFAPQEKSSAKPIAIKLASSAPSKAAIERAFFDKSLPNIANPKWTEAEPDIVRIETENQNSVMDPDDMKPKIRATMDVVLARPLEEPRMNSIAARIRELLPVHHRVGIRFSLASALEPGRDPEAGRPFYYWRLYANDVVEVTNDQGLTPSEVQIAVRAFVPPHNEKMIGFWVDHSFLNGLVALSEAGGKTYFRYLIGPETRYEIESGTGIRKAVASEGPHGRFLADGVETDRMALRILDDGRLLVFGGDGIEKKLPWLIASPVTLASE